jgi:hypothetical protein
VVVLLLPSPESDDPQVQQWIAAERALRGKRRPRNEPDFPTPEPKRLRAVAEVFFADWLTLSLRNRLRLSVVAEEELRAALRELNLTAEEAARRPGAERLCARLDCDALLLPRLERVAVQETATRDVGLWMEVQIAYLRPEVARSLATGDDKRPPDFSIVAQRAVFPVSGAASIRRLLLQEGYVLPAIPLLEIAARRAADAAAHTLRTGEISPLAVPGVRLALSSVPSPTRADKLLFTPQGRRLITDAVTGLPADVSRHFRPDLLPLFLDDTPSGAAFGRALGQQGRAVEALWTPDGQPDIAVLQALAQPLRADYFLLARVTDISLEEGPVESPNTQPAAPETPQIETSARAGAVGALVRVFDGAILWRERATATMTGRRSASPAVIQNSKSSLPDLTVSVERKLCEDAARFALLQLQREWRQYRLRFER